MAAPCIGVVVRSMWQFRSINRTSATLIKGIRHFSTSGQCSCAVKLKNEPHKPASQWKLYGAVCLQRLPVVSKDPNPIEEKFADLMQQVRMSSLARTCLLFYAFVMRLIYRTLWTRSYWRRWGYLDVLVPPHWHSGILILLPRQQSDRVLCRLLSYVVSSLSISRGY